MENWRRHSIFWPLLLITAGVLLFLNNLNSLPGTTWDLILRLWPVLLVAAGLDGFWRGDGYAGATVVTGLGVIFLMGNLGYLAPTAWDLVLRLWPLFLVALGLDIIIGRRQRWSALIGLPVGLLVTGGVFWLVMNAPLTPTTFKTEQVSFALNDASKATGTIVMPAGKLALAGGAEGGTLLTGSVTTHESENLRRDSSTSGGQVNFHLESRGYSAVTPFSGGISHQEWKLMLHPAPAYALDLKLGVGEQDLVLTGLKLSSLNSQLAVGKLQVTLPAGGSFPGRIQLAVGEAVIYVARGTPLRIRFERALASTTQPPDFNYSGQVLTSPGYVPGSGIDLTVNVALGSIVVKYIE